MAQNSGGPRDPAYLEAVARSAKANLPSKDWEKIDQSARSSAGAPEIDKASHLGCPPGMVRRNGKCVPVGSSSSKDSSKGSTTYKQEEPPTNKFGLTAAQTLQVVSARKITEEQKDPHAWATGRFDQSTAKYVVPAPSDDVTCGTCRFFLRSDNSELGRCQVVEGDIAWFASSDYYIAAEEEAAIAFDVIQQDEIGPTNLEDLWKAWESHAPFAVRPWLVQKTVRRCKADELDPDKPKEDQVYCVLDDAGEKILGRHKTRADADSQLANVERFSKQESPSFCDLQSPDYDPAKCRTFMAKGGVEVSSIQDLRVAARLAFSAEGSRGLEALRGSARVIMPRTPELTKQALSVVPPSIPDTARVVFVSATPTPVEASRGVPLAGPDGRTFREVYTKALGLPDGDWGVIHAVPHELDIWDGNTMARQLDQEIEHWSEWLSSNLIGKEDRIVIALGRAAKNALGDKAHFSLPHPAAIRRQGDSGEVGRKLRAVKREVVKRALQKLVDAGSVDRSLVAKLTGSDAAASLEVELAIGDAAHELINKRGDRIQRALDPIFKDDADELQVVYGVVLTPYVVDTQDHWVPPADIQKAAHHYIPTSRVIGTDHERVSTAFPVESWIESYPTSEDYQLAMENEDHRAYRRKFGGGVLRSGEWVQGTKIPDGDEWTAVKTGVRASYSMGGSGVLTPGDESQMPSVEFIDIG